MKRILIALVLLLTLTACEGTGARPAPRSTVEGNTHFENCIEGWGDHNVQEAHAWCRANVRNPDVVHGSAEDHHD